jgi:hypothetical protein
MSMSCAAPYRADQGRERDSRNSSSIKTPNSVSSEPGAGHQLELYDRMWAQPDYEGTPWMQIRILARS